MKVEFKLAEYMYKLIVTIMALCISKERMSRASKFLRESESKPKPKSTKRKKTKKRPDSS